MKKGRKMHFHRFSRIYFHFFLPITFISVFPLLVLGFGIANMDRRAMIIQSSRELSSLASLVMNELQITIDDLLRDSGLAASLPGIVSMNREIQTEVLGQLFLHDSRLSFIDIVSPEGQLLTSSHPDRQVFHREEAFKKAVNGNQSWYLQKESFNNHRYFIIYTPIRITDRTIAGILAVHVDLMDLTGIIEKVQSGHSRSIVIDSMGHIILHPDRELIMRGDRGPWLNSLHEKKLIGNGTCTYPIENQKYDVGYATLVDYNWTVLIERPDSEVIAPAQRAYKFTIMAILVAMLFVLTALSWLVNWLTRPIRELAEVSKEFALGNSTAPLPHHSSKMDEIDCLISEFGKMRETLSLKTMELRFNEEKYKALFETVGDAIFIYDPETFKIIEANEATSRLYGYSRSELIGLSCLNFSAQVEDSKMIAKKMEEIGHAEVPIRHHRDKMGNDIFVQLSGYRTMINGKRVMFSVCRDITPTIMAEREKENLKEQIFQIQKMESIGQLAGGIAHDFNNQLTGIMGFADLIEPGLDDETIINYATKIRMGAQNAAKLTSQLLTYARKGRFSQEMVNLYDVMDEVKGILSHTIDKRIKIREKRSLDTPTIRGDRYQIQNAILNIALNSKDAIIGSGHINFEIDLVFIQEDLTQHSLELKTGRYVLLSIKDDGSGMDESIQKHIFEPFFTTKEIGKGTGMGLSAAYGTVKHHGGDIIVKSAPGSGSCFQIYLPYLDMKEKDDKSNHIKNNGPINL